VQAQPSPLRERVVLRVVPDGRAWLVVRGGSGEALWRCASREGAFLRARFHASTTGEAVVEISDRAGRVARAWGR
jgi:hypothetical protein